MEAARTDDDLVGTACELHRDWRNDVEGLGALFQTTFPIVAT